ncbi:hypothetical protein T492DRAFT_887113 [Pavlovales sp. CCMP2436]|nr:hypothetical protein T492DRAFT_887113 [Pavlovales sp. CCMP2436]
MVDVGATKALLYCKTCTKPGMVDVVNPRCTGEGCKNKALGQRTQPSFADKGAAKAMYCKMCAKLGMVDVVNPRCANCLQTCANSSYGDGSVCALCYAVLNPGAKMKRDVQTKERTLHRWLVSFLAESADWSHLRMEHNETVKGGRGKERPDFCIDLLSHVVILECDEDKHARESYDERGTKHPSCFGLKHGVLVLTGTADWLARVKLVAARLLHHFAHEFLFYGDDARARDDGASGSADAPVAPNPYEAFARKLAFMGVVVTHTEA